MPVKGNTYLIRQQDREHDGKTLRIFTLKSYETQEITTRQNIWSRQTKGIPLNYDAIKAAHRVNLKTQINQLWPRTSPLLRVALPKLNPLPGSSRKHIASHTSHGLSVQIDDRRTRAYH